MQKWLIGLGLVLIMTGLLWPFINRLGLGRLPGDIVIARGNVHIYFPLVTCLIISALLSLLFWLSNR
jgi:hypothetical protein